MPSAKACRRACRRRPRPRSRRPTPCLFLVDARAGASAADRAFADLVRKSGKPAIVVANKSEGRAGAAGALEAYALGLGEPVAISAEHGEGLADLYDCASRRAARGDGARESDDTATPLPEQQADPDRDRRPAEYRQIDADQPPARRGPAVDRTGSWHHARCDRGRSRLARPAFSHSRHRRACAAARGSRRNWKNFLSPTRSTPSASPKWSIVLIDAQTPFEEQDIRIADLVEREGRASVIAINKWDLVEAGARRSCRACARESIACCRRSRACRSSRCRRRAERGSIG